MGQVVELNKRFLEGYLQLKDEPKIQDLRNKVLKYNRLLRDLGLRDHQVRPLQTPLGYLNVNANPGSTSHQSRVEDFWVVAVSDFTSLGLVDFGSSGSHPQWTDIHFSVHHLPQKSQGCVSFCWPQNCAKLYCRGSGCLHSQGCWSGRTWYMEGAHLFRSCASPLRSVRLHRDRRHDSGWGSAQISTLDTIYRGFRVTVHRIRCFEVRRGRNGCSEVRSSTRAKA